MSSGSATPGRWLRWAWARSQRGRRLGWGWRLATAMLLWWFMMSLGLAIAGIEIKG